jgi:hypothetical protein
MIGDSKTSNDKLVTLYKNLCATAANLPGPLIDRLHCPFFPAPREKWFRSTQRILIVGQEPHDWGFDSKQERYSWPHPSLWCLRAAIDYPESAEALMWAYRTHMYEIPAPPSKAPYEQATDIMMSTCDRKGNGDILTTNLFRCALDIERDPRSRSPLVGTKEEIQKIQDWQRGCLTEEIRILEPTAVVFFTGPDYDITLHDEFPGLEMTAVDDRPIRQFASVFHKALPTRAFRTYHPGHLIRDPGKWPWVAELGESVLT